MEGMGATSPSNDYAYNGKELNEDLGLNLSDYGARWYDAALGRWGAVDPLAEKYTPWSGYNYVMNNPAGLVDPDGMRVTDPLYYTSSQYMADEAERGKKSQEDRMKTEPVKEGTPSGCPDCLKKGDQIPGTNATADADETEIVSTRTGYKGSWMYAVLGDTGPLDESENPYIWTSEETQAAVSVEMEIAMTLATGPLAELGMVRLGKKLAPVMAWWRAEKGGYCKILNFTAKQLQSKFKHAEDFGVMGNYSRSKASEFSAAINQHINASGTQIIQGAYRNSNNLVTYYLNPATGLNVIATRTGQFISGAKLSTSQISDIMTKGFLW